LLDLLSYPTRRSSDLDADVPGQSPDVGNGAKDPDGTRYGGGIGKDLVPAHPNIIATGSRHIAKGDHQGFLLLGQLHLPPDDLGYQGAAPRGIHPEDDGLGPIVLGRLSKGIHDESLSDIFLAPLSVKDGALGIDHGNL